jgi:hypothetical protein
MEDIFLFLVVWVFYCAGSCGLAVFLFKVFFPAVPDVGLIKDKTSLEDRQTDLRHTAHFNPKIQFFSFKVLD